ncbi:unnamed protein product [Scytosiphon promiscuus]
MGEFQRWNTHHSHVVPIEVCGTQLNIAQDPTSDNLGTTIWDASVILVRYMERNPHLYSRRKLEGKRVLELGAGCGLAGMYFALQGADVTFTDLIEVVPLLQRNVTMNLGGQAAEPTPAPSSSSSSSSSSSKSRGKGGKGNAPGPTSARPRAKVLEYDWGTPLDKLSPPYDYVVACDCVYVERLVESLVWSMAQCSGRTTTVLVASEKREEVTYAKFRERLSEDFTVRQAPRRHMDKAYDHENSEVLVCKLRRNNGGGSGAERLQSEGGEGGKVAATGSGPAPNSGASTEGAHQANGGIKREEGDVGGPSGGGGASCEKEAGANGAPESGVEDVTGDGFGGDGDSSAAGGCVDFPVVRPAAATAAAPAAKAGAADDLSLDAVCLGSSSSPSPARETTANGTRTCERKGERSLAAVEVGTAAKEHDR